MITKNINISKGGAIVIVTSLTFDDNKMVTNITIKVICTNVYVTLNRRTLQHKYTYETYYYKTSFPIVLTYIIIGHKAHVATITSKVLVHIKKSFAPDLTYVMLDQELQIVQIQWFEIV